MEVNTTGTFIGWFGLAGGRPAVTATVAGASPSREVSSFMRTE